MSNWIKTKDRLPKDSTAEVLFRVDVGYVFLGTWNEYYNEWWDDSTETEHFTKDEVIAWCPIPEYDLND